MGNSTIAILFCILIAFGIILILSILAYVNKLLKHTVEQIKNSTEFDLLNWIQFNVIPNTIDAINQTLADQYKIANDDGKLTKEEANELFRMALASVYNQISAEVQERLSPIIGNMDEWLTNAIEQYIRSSKSNSILSIIEPDEYDDDDTDIETSEDSNTEFKDTDSDVADY